MSIIRRSRIYLNGRKSLLGEHCGNKVASFPTYHFNENTWKPSVLYIMDHLMDRIKQNAKSCYQIRKYFILHDSFV